MAREKTPKRAPRKRKLDTSAAPRCRSRIPVEIRIGGRTLRGAIADMSASGARIVGAELQVARGTVLEVRYASASTGAIGGVPRPIHAEFVRATEDGFAVRILKRDGAS